MHEDADLDGYGDISPPSATLLLAGTDCDDSNAAANQGQVDCSTVDDDCDGFVNDDSAIDVTVFYQDSDGDGFGDPDVEACFVSSKLGSLRTRRIATIRWPSWPGKLIVADGIDQNCDIYEACYVNADGMPLAPDITYDVDLTCNRHYLDNYDDCDDSDPTVYPGAAAFESIV